MDARVRGASDPPKTDENNRLFGLFNDRDNSLHLFFLRRCDHWIGVGRNGTWKVSSQITVVGLNIHNKSLILRKPLAEGLGVDELGSSDFPWSVIGVESEKSDEGGDDENRRAD